MAALEIKFRGDNNRAEVSIERGLAWRAVEEAFQLFLETLSQQDRDLVLGELCRHFGHYEERS